MRAASLPLIFIYFPFISTLFLCFSYNFHLLNSSSSALFKFPWPAFPLNSLTSISIYYVILHTFPHPATSYTPFPWFSSLLPLFFSCYKLHSFPLAFFSLTPFFPATSYTLFLWLSSLLPLFVPATRYTPFPWFSSTPLKTWAARTKSCLLKVW